MLPLQDALNERHAVRDALRAAILRVPDTRSQHPGARLTPMLARGDSYDFRSPPVLCHRSREGASAPERTIDDYRVGLPPEFTQQGFRVENRIRRNRSHTALL